MVRDSMETETLARLYLDQGHPERAAPIFERILAENPGRGSAAEGLARCRAAMQAQAAEDGMDREKKLNILKRLLSRLTGEALPTQVLPTQALPDEAPAPKPPPDLPVEEAKPVPPPIPSAPKSLRARKIQLLQAMLQRLTEA